MNRLSLRARVTAFYVGMLALALAFFSVFVYGGVRTYLTRSLEKQLRNSADAIVTDFLIPFDTKGQDWFVDEIAESYPAGIGDPFVRVSLASRVLYQSRDVKESLVGNPGLPTADHPMEGGRMHRAFASGGQAFMLYSTAYLSPKGEEFIVETGANMEPLLELLRRLLLILLIGTPAILALSAAGGYLLMAQPLQPVVILTEQAEHIGRKQMGGRLTVIPTGDELERLSLALNRMIDRLEESLSHNQRFSADASHELRTPLTIIRGELESLLQLPGLPNQASDGIASALEEGDRMARIVNSLMAITRLDSGGERMEMQHLDLAALLYTTFEQMSLLADEKEIQFSCEAESPIIVLGDAMRLKQVIVNLLDNAIRYTSRRGIIGVRLAVAEGQAILTVSDNGIGIAAHAQPLVFDRFYRTDQARSRESGGTGLGLAIVKVICAAHDGSVSVESVEGSGTTLRVALPVLSPSQQEFERQMVPDGEQAPQAQLS